MYKDERFILIVLDAAAGKLQFRAPVEKIVCLMPSDKYTNKLFFLPRLRIDASNTLRNLPSIDLTSH